MRAALVGVLLLVVVVAWRPSPAPRTCTYLLIRPDTVLIASYPPPCNPNERPNVDTVQTWRLPSRSKYCTGHLLVDALAGEARVHWSDCTPEPQWLGGVLLRADG